MISRRIGPELDALLRQSPALLLTGPRQSGKTTLAREIAARRRSAVYLDLKAAADRARLTEPELYFADHPDSLLVIDEVQRVPGLFETLRGTIDRGRREGRMAGRFLLLGPAAFELLAQGSETLAGRIALAELAPLDLTEVGSGRLEDLWVRGGFPASFLAPDGETSLRWRRELVDAYLERDIPQLGPRIPHETLRRLWTMLVHRQGVLLNASQLARGLGVSSPTAAGYLDLMVHLLLVRRLPPRLADTGKRLVRSPKIYVRDSGLLHALLGLGDSEALLGHPVASASWEGLVIENALAVGGERVEGSFYRTSGGAEVDLVLSWPDGREWAIDVQRTSAPRPTRGMRSALDDIGPERAFIVYPGNERMALGGGVAAIGLGGLCAEIGAG